MVYETGEVIGHSASADVPIRHDWAQHLSALGGERSSLMELVVSHNGEEYERGISKLWLSRVEVSLRLVTSCRAWSLSSSLTAILPLWSMLFFGF